MKKIFTSFLVLVAAGFMSVNATVTPVATTDNLTTVITNAAQGDTLVLADGTYAFTAAFSITKGFTLKAQNPLAVTLTGAAFDFKTTSLVGNLVLEGLIFDGTRTSAPTYASYFMDFTTSFTNFDSISVENCKISNYGNCLLRANRQEGTLTSIKLNNCIINTIGYVSRYPLFQATKTKINTLEVTNSTIYNTAVEFFQLYGTAGGIDNGIALFKNNTLFNVVTDTARTPFSGKSGTFYMQNCILVNMSFRNKPCVNFATTFGVREATNNLIYNACNTSMTTLSTTAWTTITGTQEVMPEFKDTAARDFTLPVGSAIETANIGDPRWFSSDPSQIVQNPNMIDIQISQGCGMVYFSSEARKAEIISLTGSVVARSGNVSEMSLINLSKGLYFVRLTDQNGVTSNHKLLNR
jgi:hypothetical protein